MQLRRWVDERGEIDDFSRWLILQGISFQGAEKGLEPFVEAWENAIRDIIRFGGSDLEEWDHDIWPREELHDALQHAPTEEREKYRERIAKADQLFCSITVEEKAVLSQEQQITWWRHRWPDLGGGVQG